ncbi:MAG: HAMP domain-containing protein [Acidobacteria bacterium]|nr:HAMP domain-containing protein [Acidobacteriota bacterium]
MGWTSGVFQSLRGRLTLLACLATLPAFLFVLYAASQERQVALGRAESEARYVASLASREHAHQVIGAERLLGRLAEMGAASGQPRLEPLQSLLPSVLRGFPQCANLGILDGEGRLVFSVVPPDHAVDMKGNLAFEGALQAPGVALGRYQVGQIVGRPVLILAQAVRDRQEHLLGVLFAALDLAWLKQLANQPGMPPGYALLIVDRDGRVLARSEGTGRGMAEEGGLLPEFRELRDSSRYQSRGRGVDGIPRLYSVVPMAGVPDLYAAVSLPEERVTGLANRAFLRAVLALAVLTLLTVASSIAAADLSVLRDLRLLARATRAFGGGDLAARAPVPPATGEIRDLATAFNGMAEALEARHREATLAHDQLRALSHRLQAAREEEGARIARELHDQLGQELTALKLELGRMRRLRLVGSSGTAELDLGLEQMGAQIDACVDSIRKISSELHPSVLDRLGLAPALEWLIREFERRSGLPCDFTAEGDLRELEPQVATALFRITQEALTNILRHAEARKAEVDIREEGGQLFLCIRDDGRGFHSGEAGASLGLLGMGERARLLGGCVDVISRPGEGTSILARVPRISPKA